MNASIHCGQNPYANENRQLPPVFASASPQTEVQQMLLQLAEGAVFSRAEWAALLRQRQPADSEFLFPLAEALRQAHYGNNVYIRGLIEFTNDCKSDCLYCGIRRSNHLAKRYRLTEQQILDCCLAGYKLGFRTFVLQGGENPAADESLTRLVLQIKQRFPDCALTLSAGERPEAVYRRWFEAGADRYLLRHETADPDHYAMLHPPQQTWQRRMACLHSLKDIGYQVGCGFMVGSPGQTDEHLAADLAFLQEFRPHMVGIGPFIPHKDTPLRNYPAGTLELTLFLLGTIRLLLPQVLLPATTALGTIHPQGRELGIRAGANVIMPNLSPADVRENYMLYDNKLHTGCEAAEHLNDLRRRLNAIGCDIAVCRGDSLM